MVKFYFSCIWRGLSSKLFLEKSVPIEIAPCFYMSPIWQGDLSHWSLENGGFQARNPSFLYLQLTLKYSTRPRQVILFPLISLTSRFLGLNSHGIRIFKFLMKSSSISVRGTWTLFVSVPFVMQTLETPRTEISEWTNDYLNQNNEFYIPKCPNLRRGSFGHFLSTYF